MSLVTQIYDGTSLPVAIHCAIEDPQDFNTNIDLPSRAAAERGVIPMPMKRASHVVWWRLGGDIHLLAVEEGDSTRMSDFQKAVIRMPTDCIAINVLVLSSQGSSCVLGVVGTIPSGEVMCARLQLIQSDSSDSQVLRPLRDVFTSLKGRQLTVIAASAAAGSASGEQIKVLISTAQGELHTISIDDEGSAHTTLLERSQDPVTAISVLGTATFVLARASGKISLLPSASQSEAPLANLPMSAKPTSIVASVANNSSVTIAVATESSDCILINVSENRSNVIHQIVSQPIDGATIGSLFIGSSGTAMIGWLGANLWATPTTCASAHRRSGHGTCVVGRYNFGTSFEGTLNVWHLPHEDNEPFWFLFPSSGCTFMATSNPLDGICSIFVAENYSTVAQLVATRVIGDYADEEGLNHVSIENKKIFEVTVSPLCITSSPLVYPQSTRAFQVGLSLLRSVSNSVQSLHYLFYRALACPARFTNFSEFSELRTDALLASFNEDEVTENDVKEALAFTATTDGLECPLFRTSLSVQSAVLQELAARLSFLIVVYAGWVGTARQSFATSGITAEVGHRAEVLAASIRAVISLQTSLDRLLDDAESDSANSSKQVAAIIDTLGGIAMGDSLQIIHVAQQLSGCGPTGGLACSQWVTTLKGRYPLLSHFHVISSFVINSTRGQMSTVVQGEIYSVASHLSQFPLEVSLQLLAALGSYSHLPIPNNIEADAAVLASANPTMVSKLYQALMLQRALGGHGGLLSPEWVERACMPAIHILRRYAGDAGNTPHLDGLLRDLVVDATLFLSRAAIDNEEFPEAFRLLAVANREAMSNPERASIEASVQQCTIAIVDKVLARGRACDICNCAISDVAISEVIAQRLYVMSIGQANGQSSAPMLAHSRIELEAAERVRLSHATVLYEFLTTRHAFGTSAHSLFTIAAAARTSNQTTVHTMPLVVTLLALAVASAKCIPVVAPPPAPLVEAAADTCTLGGSFAGGMVRQMSLTAPLFALGDLKPMSHLDTALLQKRLFQSRCEYKLQRLARNVVKGPWREDAGDRARMERLVSDLLAVRLWDDALKLSRLCHLDSSVVFQCEAADLASMNYQTNVEAATQWRKFIAKLGTESTVSNGQLPLRKAIASALIVNHRNVPPPLKMLLAQRDLGALINILLHSGKVGAGASTKQIPLNTILEVLDWSTRYVKATENEGLDAPAAKEAMLKHGLGEGAFVSYAILERVAVLAQSAVLVMNELDKDKAARRNEVAVAAAAYISLLKKRL